MSTVKNNELKKINSISDFQKVFYPNEFKLKNMESINNPVVLGATLAQQSLRKIKYKFSKNE